MGLSIHRWRALPVAKPCFANVEIYYARLCERVGFQQFGRDGGP
jgi:glutathione S-transferase